MTLVNKTVTAGFFCALLLSPTSWSSNEGVAVESRFLDVLKAAEPLERVAPKYPMLMARTASEGWVRVSFVVDEEGNVVDPIVHDSSGSKAFEKSALKAVQQWRYEPATFNGEPVEQCNSKVQLDFKIEGQKGVSRKFLRRYKKLRTAIRDKNMDDATELFTEFKEKPQRNFSENVHFSVLSAMYYEVTGETDALQDELTNIVNNGREYLDPDSYLSFVYNRLLEQIQTNQLASAKGTANNAVQHFPEHPTTQNIRDILVKVDAFIAANDTIVVPGKIQADKTWSHKLIHNKFEVSTEKTKFDRIEVRCDNKRSSFGGVSYQTVIVPDEWGQCYIYVDAPEDTEFSLVEIAS